MDCNEMSNHLCQMSCLPGELGKGVCAKIADFPFLFLLLSFLLLPLAPPLPPPHLPPVSPAPLTIGEDECRILFSSRATKQSASFPLLTLLSKVTSEKHMANRLLIWIQTRQMMRAGKLAQCTTEGAICPNFHLMWCGKLSQRRKCSQTEKLVLT